MNKFPIDAKLEEMNKKHLKIRKLLRFGKLSNIPFVIMGIFLFLCIFAALALPMINESFAEDILDMISDNIPYIFIIIFVSLFIFIGPFGAIYRSNLKKINDFENQYKTRVLSPVLNNFPMLQLFSR